MVVNQKNSYRYGRSECIRNDISSGIGEIVF